MIRARLWFRCAAVGDPVSPVQMAPARIGWEAKKRVVGLTIDRGFSGDELLRRMKGWITVDPDLVIETIKPHGRIKVLDDRLLVVEMEDRIAHEKLNATLTEMFPGQVDLEPMSAPT
ncbi:MAG: hypothetical protein AB1641_23410 [Thermodesulfobacteriota bacterium]